MANTRKMAKHPVKNIVIISFDFNHGKPFDYAFSIKNEEAKQIGFPGLWENFLGLIMILRVIKETGAGIFGKNIKSTETKYDQWVHALARKHKAFYERRSFWEIPSIDWVFIHDPPEKDEKDEKDAEDLSLRWYQSFQEKMGAENLSELISLDCPEMKGITMGPAVHAAWAGWSCVFLEALEIIQTLIEKSNKQNNIKLENKLENGGVELD